MTPYKLVIFDFDGTLADSAPWFISTLASLAQRHRFRSPSEAEVQMLRGKSNRDIIRYLGIRWWQMPAIARDLRSKSAAAASQIPLFEGVEGLLLSLRAAGAQVAIVSSNGEATVREVLGPSAALINHYACKVSLFGKAAKFGNLKRSLGLRSTDIIAIGDECRDVEAARKAGFASAAVTWGYATQPALDTVQPSFIATSFEDLRRILSLSP